MVWVVCLESRPPGLKARGEQRFRRRSRGFGIYFKFHKLAYVGRCFLYQNI